MRFFSVSVTAVAVVDRPLELGFPFFFLIENKGPIGFVS